MRRTILVIVTPELDCHRVDDMMIIALTIADATIDIIITVVIIALPRLLLVRQHPALALASHIAGRRPLGGLGSLLQLSHDCHQL